MNNQENNNFSSQDQTLQDRYAKMLENIRKRKLQKNRLAKFASKKISQKITKGSDGIFFALLLLAIIVDLLEYIDLGFFSAVVNIGIYILVVVTGFVLIFFKANGSKMNIWDRIKGQLWKYMILPIFEIIPVINLLPFWTGTVVMLWLKTRRERNKILNNLKEQERKQRESQILGQAQVEY